MHFPEGRISSEEVRRCTDQPPLTHINTSSALSSSVTLHVLIQGPQSSPLPRDWNRHSGRLRHTWLRTVDSNTVKSEWTDCHYFVFGSASLLYIKCAGMVRSF